MTSEILGTLLGVQAVVIGIVIRTVWKINERVSRLEGRFNGNNERRH